MKKTILTLATLSIFLLTSSTFAQKAAKVQKEIKTEIKQKNQLKKPKVLVKKPNNNSENSSVAPTSSKVEERGIATPDHWHAPTEEIRLDVPDTLRHNTDK